MPSLDIRLADARIRKGLKKHQVADILGVTRQTIHRWESGSRPFEYHLAAIANFLGEDIAELRAEVKP